MPPPSRLQTARILNRCLSPAHNSAARYILDSNPYLQENDQEAVKTLGEIATADQNNARKLIVAVTDLEGIPQPGLPDVAFAELNYLSYPYLLDAMIGFREKAIAVFEEASKALEADGAKERDLVAPMLAEMKAQAQKLRDVRARRYKKEEPAKAPEGG